MPPKDHSLPSERPIEVIGVDGSVRSEPEIEAVPLAPIRRFVRNLIYTSLLVLGPGGGFVLMLFAVWVAAVVPTIHAARGQMLSSEADYHEMLRHSAGILEELGALGAPSDQIRAVYFAFADAQGDSARPMADAYFGLLLDQAKASPHYGETRLPELLAPVDRARMHTASTHARWSDLLGSPRGRFALFVGAVSGPTPGMGVYARRHPRW